MATTTTPPLTASNTRDGFPYSPNHVIALILLIAALTIIFATGIWWFAQKMPPGYTMGGAAAVVGILLILALVLEAPALILDDKPEQGGEPSTMRILALVIVLTFCILMLRTGWNDGELPSLEGPGTGCGLSLPQLVARHYKSMPKFKRRRKKKRNELVQSYGRP